MRPLFVALLVAAASAAQTDRGWSPGVPAADAAALIAGKAPTPVDLPASVASRVSGPTVLFFFSPTCPHCRHVAAEIEALHASLTARKLGAVLGIVSGSGTAAELAEFQATFHTTFPMVVDADRAVQTAMGARSTPSAMLVEPAGKGKVRARDAWLPFYPGWSALVLGRVTGNPFEAYAPGKYVGTAACAPCHGDEHASWTLTLHAVAWRALTRGGTERDPKCTGCHVTGAGQPTGWDGDPTSALVDVQCEACHGPGGPHDGARQDAATACAACHDAQHSIAFDLQKALPLIDHYRADTLSSEAFEAARRALYDGTAPQTLIAMPQGKNVGSAACLACHEAEHTWWSSDPHAAAMDSLRAKGSTDPACVRCHATAKASGPPPTTLAGFDRLGGVGCESCHGPGETHVAAKGGVDNIVGLGESCPVCVIDAVCTSCHTPEWSPEWNLEAALAKIQH